MMISNDGLQAQGETLPAIARHGTIQPVTALSKRQRGWRIKHPQAVTEQGKTATYTPDIWHSAGDLSVFGGMGREPKKTPPLCCSFVPALLCGYPIRLVHRTRNHPMIFTFCITRSRGPIAALPAIRTISVYATNEAQARTRLAGLPLVFLSRCPAREVAA